MENLGHTEGVCIYTVARDAAGSYELECHMTLVLEDGTFTVTVRRSVTSLLVYSMMVGWLTPKGCPKRNSDSVSSLVDSARGTRTSLRRPVRSMGEKRKTSRGKYTTFCL